jgi:ATP-binding cassette subfamily B multidrug efflux pump
VSSALIRSLRFLRAYRWYAVLGVVSVLATTVADLVGPQILRQIIDVGITHANYSVIWWGSFWLVAVAVFDGFANFFSGYFSAKASHGSAFSMRNEIFSKLQSLSFAYHDRAQTGQLITRVTSDVDQVRDFVGSGLVQVVASALMLVGAAILLFRMNVELALLSFTVVPATVLVLWLFVSRLGPMFRARQQKLAALNTVLQENIAGVRVVRAFAREHFEIERYHVANSDLLEQGLIVRKTVANAFPLMFSIGTIGVAFVTWAGAAQIIAGTLTVGQLVAFSAYIFLLLGPLTTLGFGAQQIAQSGASAERLFEVLDAPEDVAEKPDAIRLSRIEGRVDFEDVHLRYPGSTGETLRGVTATIEPNTTVAIVGATGSGKTTLVNLIPRFYDPTRGVVRVDGHDVRDLALDSLRGQIGFVMQDTVLFSSTIRENISYGRPDATVEEIEAAARAAQAHDFIMGLPEGYDTRIGERGVKLSGGQRQRVAIARALLIDPRILVMDDSTSSVDSATEAAIRTQLDTLMTGRTTLVIAQRLATARRADLVLVMDRGMLVERGTHAELIERSCLYAEIAASQLVEGHE